MIQVTCPGCAAKVTFRADTSVFAVCPYCQGTLVRSDVDVELIGKMALVNDDWSPLQLATSGAYKNVGFLVVGRVKLRWERGTWNEWFLVFDDGRTGWMSEAQGFYCVSFAVEDATGVSPLSDLDPQSIVQLAGASYTVEDIKRATCSFSEGELPFKAQQGRSCTSIDLGGEGKSFATIEYADDGIRVFVGTYEDFDDLSFSNLRQLDGWS